MDRLAEMQEYIIPAQPGRTLTEQQLMDLQAQLISLRGEVAEAKARFDALAASEGTDPGSIATIGSFSNRVLTRLRDQYLDDGAGTTLRKLRASPINPQTSSASPLDSLP